LVHVLDTKTWEWSEHETKGPGPSKRHSHSAVYNCGNMIVFGGYENDGDSFNPRDRNVYSLDLNTWIWSQIPAVGEVPPPLFSHTALVIDGQMLVVGSSYYVPPEAWTPTSDRDIKRVDTQWDNLDIGMRNVVAVLDIVKARWHPLSLNRIFKGRLFMQHTSTLIKRSFGDSDLKLCILGGGGNCYFFGPHFNDMTVLKLSEGSTLKIK